MPQSLSRILVHLVFSTKDRGPMLTPAIRRELHPYLAVVLRENDCPALEVGGVEDHVHLFFGLSRTVAVAKVVEAVKTSSSKWIKTKGLEFAGFHWQGGYGAFSAGQSGGCGGPLHTGPGDTPSPGHFSGGAPQDPGAVPGGL